MIDRVHHEAGELNQFHWWGIHFHCLLVILFLGDHPAWYLVSLVVELMSPEERIANIGAAVGEGGWLLKFASLIRVKFIVSYMCLLLL